MNKELIDDFNLKISNLEPQIDYWDFDTNSFQYIIETFFPYIADLDFWQFTCRERYFEHIETNLFLVLIIINGINKETFLIYIQCSVKIAMKFPKRKLITSSI